MGKFSSALAGHSALYGLGFLRRESNGRLAAVEFLHVDPGVVAALDRADDDARATGIEHGEGRRLVPARVGVRVVADDRRVRDAAVDSPVDACEPGRDLVHGAVQVVDPALQRDREVDEIFLAAADEHELGRAHPSHRQPHCQADAEREHGCDRGTDCDPRCRRAREVHARRILVRAGHGGVSEKRTLYSAVLFEVLVSPGTGETSTLIDVGPLKLTAPMCVKTTVFVCPGSITSIVVCFTIGVGFCWIVSVTGMLSSREFPLFWTATANASWSVANTVVSAVVESSVPFGSALTETRFVPCSPPRVTPVCAPRIRSRIAASEAELASSGFSRKLESGTVTWTPWPSSTRLAGSLKLSSQTTSLAISRSA